MANHQKRYFILTVYFVLSIGRKHIFLGNIPGVGRFSRVDREAIPGRTLEFNLIERCERSRHQSKTDFIRKEDLGETRHNDSEIGTLLAHRQNYMMASASGPLEAQSSQ